MGLFSRKPKGPSIKGDGYLMPENGEPAFNEGPGTYKYNVVGESHYNANLRAVLKEEGYRVADGGECYLKAMLLCEPNNQYDPNAVAVVISTRRVGYIQKEDAKALSPKLKALAENGQVLFVDAVIGWRDPMKIGVRLDLEYGSSD